MKLQCGITVLDHKIMLALYVDMLRPVVKDWKEMAQALDLDEGTLLTIRRLFNIPNVLGKNALPLPGCDSLAFLKSLLTREPIGPEPRSESPNDNRQP